MKRLLVVLTLLSLVPIWAFPYPALQDYPQHLFQARVVADPAAHPEYQVHLAPTYSVFYLVTSSLARYLPLDVAGRAAVSLYLLLMALAAWRLARPWNWGALLLFPVCYNQFYFLGLLNYIYAFPILLLALLDLEASRVNWRLPLWLLALLFAHPFGLLVYLGVVILWALLTRERKYLIALAAGSLVFGLWYLSQETTPYGRSGVHFLGLGYNLRFLATFFTNTGWEASTDWSTLMLWVVALAILARCAFKEGTQPGVRMAAAAIAGGLLMGLVGPWGLGGMNFALGQRLSIVAFLFLPVLASRVIVRGLWAFALVAVAISLVLLSDSKQYRISREIATISPLIAQMEPGQAVLPLMFDQGYSDESDYYFYQPHLHDVFYYHIAKGGVAGSLWSAGTLPVDFKPGQRPAAPEPYFPNQFDWRRHAHYRYYLVRGGDEQVDRYLAFAARLVGRSGPWRLYERRSSDQRAQ
ncbi:MAG: hypothetical protein AMXMBFR33_51980 [Candidatus Xenobia bacterium]